MTSGDRLRRGPLATLTLLLLPSAAPAQDYALSSIKLDGSVGLHEVRYLSYSAGLTYSITEDLGDYSHDGATLFHSFEIFEVLGRETAEFSATLGDPQQILVRVTGDQKSTIIGTLRNTEPGADLFLMNPRGIEIGRGARLEMQGSFHATTADLLRFPDQGATFEAEAATPPPLFVTSPPSDFGFTSEAPARVQVQGWAEIEQRAYEVPAGETLSFVGGNVEILGVDGYRTIRVPGGSVQIAAVGGAGDLPVALESFDENSSNVPLGSVEVTDYAWVDVSGDSSSAAESPARRAGSIVIRAGSFTISGGAKLQASNWADAAEGEVTADRIGLDLGVRESVDVENSQLIVGNVGTAQGSRLEVRTRNLTITDGARVLSTTEDARGGDLVLLVEEKVTVSQRAEIVSKANNGGQGGDIVIKGKALDVEGKALDVLTGAVIASIAYERNNPGPEGGGDIDIGVQTLLVKGGDLGSQGVGPRQSSIAAVVEKHKNSPSSPVAVQGGDLWVVAGTVELLDGGQLYTQTLGNGDAGNVSITAADDVQISGRFIIPTGVDSPPEYRPSGVTSRTGSEDFPGTAATGSAGDIEVLTRILEVLDGGEIAASTLGAGSGGNLLITASERLLVQGSSGAGSIISVSGVGNKNQEKIGDAGRIHIVAGEMEIIDHVSVTATRGGVVLPSDELDAGEIRIDARRLRISGERAGIFSEAAGGAGSEDRSGGSIVVTTVGDFEMEGHRLPGSDIEVAKVSVSTGGYGAAGKMQIDAGGDVRIASGASLVAETSSSGGGGSIDVVADGSVYLSSEAEVSSQADTESTADAGGIQISAGEGIVSTGASVSTEAARESGGEIVLIAMDRMEFIDSEVTTSVAKGAGNGGDITLKGVGDEPVGVVVLTGSDILARAQDGAGGDISIVADGYLESGDSVLDASSDKFIDGEISIRAPANDITSEVAALPIDLLDTAALVASACSASQGVDASFQVQRRTRPAPPPDVVIGLDVLAAADPCGGRESVQ